MGANGQYDDRLSRHDCRNIRRTVRRVQGINPRVVSAEILDSGELEIVTGQGWNYWILNLRRSSDGFEVVGEPVEVTKTGSLPTNYRSV